MSIFKKNGIEGQITTSSLPSGDMIVNSPRTGSLEELVFSVCRNRGYRHSNGGWIVKREHVVAASAAFKAACITVAE